MAKKKPEPVTKPGTQSVDNYALPQVTDASTKPAIEFVEPEQPVVAEPVVEAVADAQDIDAVIEAGRSANAQPGTIGYEMNLCLDRLNSDREKHKGETKYRLECLRADANEEYAAKIDAVLKNL